jgi:hypothetical protein
MLSMNSPVSVKEAAVDNKAGKVPKVAIRFWITGVSLLLLLAGPAVYLGCGPSSEPPPAKTTAESTLSADGQPAPAPEPPKFTKRGLPAKPGKYDQFKAFDQILANLPLGNIAFNTPATININDTVSIQLILSLSKPVEELKRMIEAEGDKQGESIKVSDQMEARLTGPHFQIHAVTPESQGIASQGETKWTWEVKPLKTGPQMLHLTLTAKFAVNGQPNSRVIRTFDKKIEVNITLAHQATNFLEKYGQWLWVGIIIPLATWLWKRRKASRASPAPEKDESP